MRGAALVLGALGAVGSGALGAAWLIDPGATRALLEPPTGDDLRLAAAVLLGAAVLGVLGCALVSRRRGALAAAVFLVAFVTPLAVHTDPKLIAATFGLALAGALAFFVKPRRAAKRKRRDDHIAADTDMV
ncbi:hypothetical protein [Gemmata sp.]|uniref:hypothetical protein n=1 Tax=Gemmata sp. TaxID=1914242 RepID=UPI003F6F3329